MTIVPVMILCCTSHNTREQIKEYVSSIFEHETESWNRILRWYLENRIPKILKRNPQNPESNLRVFCWPCNSRQVSNAVGLDASKFVFGILRKCHMHSTNVASKSRFGNRSCEIEIWKSKLWNRHLEIEFGNRIRKSKLEIEFGLDLWFHLD